MVRGNFTFCIRRFCHIIFVMEYSQRKRRVIYYLPPKFALSAAYSLECRASFCYCGFYKNMLPLVLASTSPFRAQLQKKLGMPFIRRPPQALRRARFAHRVCTSVSHSFIPMKKRELLGGTIPKSLNYWFRSGLWRSIKNYG